MFKKDFPIFHDDLIYLDSAASAQKPECVIKSLNDFYTKSYSNVHRGTCALANRATFLYEEARQTVADFLGSDSCQIVLTKGATESINLVASGWSQLLTPQDEVMVCIAEHHANFVPWQQACLKSGAHFKVFSVKEDGTWDLDDFQRKLTPATKIVAVAQMSNVLGIFNPVQEVISLVHRMGGKVLVDAAQSVAHMPINVGDLDCDYLAFSGHKIYGPTGIGVLYGKKDALEILPPYQFGGDMIDKVSPQKTTFASLPARLEAGTPPIAEAIGLKASLEYVQSLGWKKIQESEKKVFNYLVQELKKIPEIQFLGDSDLKSSLISFNIKGIHPNDLAMILSKQNVCVRVGHHCAMPIHHFFGVEASIRLSLGVYNEKKDIEAFMQALKKTIGFFK